MKTLKFSAIAAVLLAMPVSAQAGDSRGGKVFSGGKGYQMMKQGGGQIRNWGGKHNGRWVGGWRAPGGWNAYRRPFVGYRLPSYWIQPSFFLGNYATYGFARPAQGYGWSRYYDDAVLTDRYGQVHDYVPGYNWDRYDGAYQGAGYNGVGYGDDSYRDGRRSGSGIGGAIAGGAIGAVAGGLIAKRGDNTEGAILGGVVGAVAGAALGNGSDKKRRRYKDRDYDNRDYGRPVYQGGNYGGGQMPYDNVYNSNADGVTTNGHWSGTWTGSYDGGPTQTWSGSYNGGYDGVTSGNGQMTNHHWQGNGPGGSYPQSAPYQQGATYQQGGYQQGGYQQGVTYGAPGVTTVTMQSQPVVTTTTTEIIEEVVYARAPVRKRVAYRAPVRAKAKAKPRCVCKVVYR